MKKVSTTVLFLVLGTLFVVLSGTSKTTCVPAPPPEEPICAVPADCEGLPHLNCVGKWACDQGQCIWHCKDECIPSAEVCGDGKDDDCDGVPDDGCCLTDKECPPGQVCQVTGPCPACPCDPNSFVPCPPCDCWGQCVEPPQPAQCYEEADCAPGQSCEITNDCCPPKGCLPGMICPAVCVPCGECVAQSGCCASDFDCPAGAVCVVGVCEKLPAPGLCWSDAQCKAGEHCIGAITCPCGAQCFAASQPGKCKGEEPLPGTACYGSDDCQWNETCQITNDCCAPEGCLPGMECPAVCVPCGECVPLKSECNQDADCGAGFLCEVQAVCPPCVYADPPCKVACLAVGKCIPTQSTECSSDADCPPGQVCTEVAECPPCVYADPPCMAPCWLKMVCQAGCTKIDPNGYGFCEMFMGYGFDGFACVGVSGCGCGDCKGIFPTKEECAKSCL